MAVLADHRHIRGHRPPSLNGRSLAPQNCYPTRDVSLTRRLREFPGSRPMPVLPRTCGRQGWIGGPWAFPRCFAPDRSGNRPRTSRWGQVEHRPVATSSTYVEPPQRAHSPHATSCRKMVKTLAAKHKSSVTKMARKYKASIDTPTAPGPASRSSCSETAAGNPWSLRRDTPQTTAHRRHRRPQADHGHCATQRADPSAPRQTVRTLRKDRWGCRSITSANSPISTSHDGGSGSHGCA